MPSTRRRPEARADAERWMDWTLASMNEPMRVVFWTLVRTPEAERDLPARPGRGTTAERLWRIVDAQLAGGTTSPAISAWPTWRSAASCTAGSNCRWTRPDLPRLRAWYDRLLERPAYRAHVAVPLS